MKAFLILEDGTVFEGIHIGADREVISEIVFNTSMAGYLEVLTDPSYAGQAVCMTYPLIGNYGICKEDMESLQPWPDGFIVREFSQSAGIDQAFNALFVELFILPAKPFIEVLDSFVWSIFNLQTCEFPSVSQQII